MFHFRKIFAELMNISIDKETEAHGGRIPEVSQLTRLTWRFLAYMSSARSSLPHRFLSLYTALSSDRRYSGEKVPPLRFQCSGFGGLLRPGLRCRAFSSAPGCRDTLQACFGHWLLPSLQRGRECQATERTAARRDSPGSLASSRDGPPPSGVPS